MTSILKADNIQDADGNNIINESSNTITIGASGDTTNIIGTLQNDGVAVANTPAFSVFLGSTQTLTTNTWTKLNLDNEIYDTNNAFASYKFTVPSGEGGKYLFVYSLGTSSLTSSTHGAIRLYKNGSAVDGSFTRSYPNQTTGAYPDKSMVLSLAAADYIELYGQHNKGSDATVSTSDTFLSGHKLIGV